MNQLLKKLNIQHPVIQAPMALADSPHLTAAISNHGGLGSLGVALCEPEQIRKKIKDIRDLTDKPFNINLFAPTEFSAYSNDEIKNELETLNYFRKKLGMPERDHIEIPPMSSFDEKLAIILEENVPVFSFTFGVLSAEIIKKIKSHGIIVIGTATTVREGKILEQHGVDAIVAQGYEAGGHRGTDLKITSPDEALIGTMALVPQLVDAVNIPVIASGGIMDARGIAASITLGASAVQMGTAFLACPESAIHDEHRKRLLVSTDESTRLTRAFTGRMARSLKNDFLLEMETKHFPVLDFPIQSALVKDIREEAKKQNNPEYMSLWAGQASQLCQTKPAGELLDALVNENHVLTAPEDKAIFKKMVSLENEAAAFGFKWENASQIMEQIRTELTEIEVHLQDNDTNKLQEEIGDLLHAAFSLCIFCKLDPEKTLSKSIKKFETRFQSVKQLTKMEGLNNLNGQSFNKLMAIWDKAKSALKK